MRLCACFSALFTAFACRIPHAAKHEPSDVAGAHSESAGSAQTRHRGATGTISGTPDRAKTHTTDAAPAAALDPGPGGSATASADSTTGGLGFGLADTDPNNDGEVAPPAELPGCLEELARLGAEFVPADIPLSQKRGQVFTCGAAQVVLYKGRVGSPKYNSSPRLTCRMALGLIRFEELLQELSRKHLGAEVRGIEQGGTYSCRKMARFTDLVSEHSYANAIDVRSVRLSTGRSISVKRHFGDPTEQPSTPESVFLRSLASRLYDDEVFSVVLTPLFDRLHHDHFHFDQARYRVDGTR